MGVFYLYTPTHGQLLSEDREEEGGGGLMLQDTRGEQGEMDGGLHVGL